MAGPSVAILTTQIIDTALRQKIVEIIRQFTKEIGEDRFDIDGSTYLWDTGEEYEGELAEYKKIGLQIHWMPRDIIGLAAMNNSQEDHINLAKICLSIAEYMQGMIAFGGDLHKLTKDEDMLLAQGVSYHQMKDILVLETILDIPAFKRWMQHKDFRMMK